jgi:8-oxo-dGTP pyrophosphatase MutT (NUDIX family)
MPKKSARVIVVHHQNLLVMQRNKFGDVYYCLIGGEIEKGETAEQAALREAREETTLKLANPRLAYIEEIGEPFGTQYVFVADYVDGEVKLAPDSIEAKIMQTQDNRFTPLWVPISKFASLSFRSAVLQQEILHGLRDGWPKQPKLIHSRAEISYTKPNNQTKRGNND